MIEQVKCPVAVFLNRGFEEGSTTSFVLGNTDMFIFPYIEKMLRNGQQLKLYFSKDDDEILQEVNKLLVLYSQQLVPMDYSDQEKLKNEDKNGLSIMSYATYSKLVNDEAIMENLPSLLVIRREMKQ